MQIFLSKELTDVLDKKAEEIGLTTPAFITDFLTNAFRDELNNVPAKSYSELYKELREAVIEYKNGLSSGDKFTLRDVPYYKNLSVTCTSGTHIVPAGVRARLGRSINRDICGDSLVFADVRRALTKTGKLAFSKKDNTNAAVYEKV